MANKTKKEKKNFLKGMKSELKKVIWPTTKQLTNSTIAVIAVVLVVAIIVSGLNFIFGIGFDKGMSKLKEMLYPESELQNTEIVVSNEIVNDANVVTNETQEQNSVENSQEIIIE